MKIGRLTVLTFFSVLLYFCKTVRNDKTQQPVSKNGEGYKRPDINWMKRFGESPVVSPEQSLTLLKTEDGFDVSVVASEPMVQTPVAMLFDRKGRIWVAEMTGYMPDVVGTGEGIPNGKIVILEDTDSDGRMDKRKIFLDSLVLPRSLCFYEDGILIAEPPGLWFYKIAGDKAVSKVLVDSVYAVGGNVEHQPNGLLRAMDNWIYNAKSNKRYRKYGDEWKIERTHFRGQWGISQDDQGRLYYNHNSANVLGDNFLPGFGHWNKNQKGVTGFNAKIVADNRVYPRRPTPGVNRGYMAGILDDSLRLVNFTAACGPLVYRGDLFGPAYASNLFVPEPSANLIKRNIIKEEGYMTPGKQAYANREFISSTDERFRPVTLTNAPDGAIYIADMYRGIIQHKTYLTPYLKQEISERSLTQPLTLGRIYKVAPRGSKTGPVELNDDNESLISMLGHPNGWIRDYAQQTIIDGKKTALIHRLKMIASSSSEGNELARLHCLWALEGLGALSAEEVLPLYDQESFRLQVTAFGLTPSVINHSNYRKFTDVWKKLIAKDQTMTFPYIAFIMNELRAFNDAQSQEILHRLAGKQPGNPYLASAIVSTVQDRESEFLSAVNQSATDTASALVVQLKSAIENRIKENNSRNQALLSKKYPKGAELYNTICQTCHGPDGNGVQGLAPPLNQSEWVTGREDILTSIVLFGLTGPVTVGNKLYKAPEISADMPGIGYDPGISNDQIAEMLSYIRKSWHNDAAPVSEEEVEQIRKKFAGREKAFTVKELEQL